MSKARISHYSENYDIPCDVLDIYEENASTDQYYSEYKEIDSYEEIIYKRYKKLQ